MLLHPYSQFLYVFIKDYIDLIIPGQTKGNLTKAILPETNAIMIGTDTEDDNIIPDPETIIVYQEKNGNVVVYIL